jgi:drug/metabolite transporter (DMT)-like permease
MLNTAVVFVYYKLMSVTAPKEHQFAGQGAVLATALLWSTSGLFIKLIDWHPIVIAGTRAFLAAIFLLVIRFIFPVPKSTKKPGFPFWAGAFANAFVVLTFVSANKLTTSANAVLLQYSAPIWTALLAWWLIKERPRWEQWGALALVIGGLVVFSKDSLGTGAFLGDGLSVISGMFIAANVVFLRMLKHGDARDVMLMSHVIAAVISIPFIIMYPPSFSVSTVVPLLYLGFIQQGMSSIFFAYGVKRISAIQVVLTATIEPLCNPIWVFAFLGEKPSTLAIIGGGIILAAVLSSTIIGKQRETVRRLL